MASIWRSKEYQFSADDGTPLNAGTLTFYTTGTTTNKNAYSNEALSTPIANPYTLASDGRPADNIWISGRYRIIVKTSGGTEIADIDAVEDTMPASDFQDGSPTYATAVGGTATAITLTFTPTLTALTDGMVIGWKWGSDTTGATTVNADGLGAKSLVTRNGAAIAAGDGQQNDQATARYNSSQNRLELMSPDGAAYKAANNTFTKAQGVSRVALTDAATIAVDASLSNVFTVTLGGNRTLGQPTNPTDGQSITIFITQDGTGSRTLAYHADWLFAGGTDPTLTTTAAAVDVLSAVYNGATTKWYGVLNRAFG